MSKENKKKQFPIHIITGVLMAAVIVLLCVPAGFRYVHRTEARQVLRHGKNLYLAVEVTAIQWEGTNKKFMDGDRSSGVTKLAEKEVTALSQVPGRYRVQSWSVEPDAKRELWYYEGGYLAHLVSEGETNSDWTVYRMDEVLH
ncbi:MAG: hypothetical protein ACOYBE_12615 [Blautia sp.]|jgi:hypothetical protein